MKPREHIAGRRGQVSTASQGDEGFMLLGLVVAIAIILMMLGVAASKVAFSLRREREVESARRADQYVRAIRKFYLKNQRYPGSMEQLENTNNVRYLRKQYVDPLTGKKDYRLIVVGQNKTTVKGFFGEPLEGIPTAGLGSAAGMQSSGVPGAPPAGGSGFGSSSGVGATGGGGFSVGAGIGGKQTGTGTGAAGTNGSAPGGGSPLGSLQGMADSTGSIGPIMGVGSNATGPSILTINGQTTYDTWEFLYDPRLEKLRLAGKLNAGMGSADAGSLGTTPGGFGNGSGAIPTSNGVGGAGIGGAPTSTTPSSLP